MNPVARITPAANALIMKNRSFSGLNAGIRDPNNGRLTPIAPATRMEAMAPSLYRSASALSRRTPSSSQVHSQETVAGYRRSRRREKM
ncbi:hypothetical protein V6N13_049391 [Hibiscus sabdariffa]